MLHSVAKACTVALHMIHLNMFDHGTSLHVFMFCSVLSLFARYPEDTTLRGNGRRGRAGCDVYCEREREREREKRASRE